jgi:shikimate dehydrogenase
MRLVVLGDPVEHSRSPAIHTAALAAVGIEGTYRARRVDDAGMASAVDEVRYGRITGANVTMPHKRLAFELADRTTENAMRSGAVNTLTRSDGEVWGYNTDVDGIRSVWASRDLPVDAPVLVVGTGGAAAGALVALAGRSLAISGRRNGSAADLLERTRVGGLVVPWAESLPGAVVVNATPLGMEGESLPHDVMAAASGFFDLTYASVESPSLRRAREAGLPTADGKELLLAQAAASFEIWTGIPAPASVMRVAFSSGQIPGPDQRTR